MNETLKQYQVKPHSWWQAALYTGFDGYEVMGAANRRGWREIPSWGKAGYDLGSWPLVMVFFRDSIDKVNGTASFLVAEYCEGDVTTYDCPSPDIREQIADEIAFYHWKAQGQFWVEAYATCEDLPDELKGPYRP